MTAVQMTEAGNPAPVAFRERRGTDGRAGTATGMRDRYLVPVLGLCLLVATTAYLMVFTLLGQIGQSLHASGTALTWLTIAAVITGTVSSALLPGARVRRRPAQADGGVAWLPGRRLGAERDRA